MQNNILIASFREKIRDSLAPLVNNDYVYLDLPYYENIGDTLIWEGTREFLRTLPHKCLYYAGKDSFRYRRLGKDVVILLQGGGNFGDLYRLHSEFRRKVIDLYPENRVIVLPQTVYYEDKSLLRGDAEFFAAHPNVTICAREQYSYDLLKAHFKNPVLLLPDMAFFINLDRYKVSKEENRVLYLKRIDKELVEGNVEGIPADAEQHDWPTYERRDAALVRVDRLFFWTRRLFKVCGFGDRFLARFEDWKRNGVYRRRYVQTGVSFLSPYRSIYTTRLHVLILGALLGKEIYLINNTSGKVVNYYNTWLRELDGIKKL